MPNPRKAPPRCPCGAAAVEAVARAGHRWCLSCLISRLDDLKRFCRDFLFETEEQKAGRPTAFKTLVVRAQRLQTPLPSPE